jgi:hypothetical protein
MAESSREQLRTTMLRFLGRLEYSGGTGHSGKIPKFDYYALDYLDFAELNLSRFGMAPAKRDRENELISCLSNLKRAVDCQVECFFESWNLRKTMKKRNLGLDSKLRFLAQIGFFSSRTINRFAGIRNRIEHDFRRPAIQDLEALFDLVTAFVAILQYGMSSGFSQQLDFYLDRFEHHRDGFSITYEAEKQKFRVEWEDGKNGDKGALQTHITAYEDFAYFFRVLLLLNQIETFASLDHVRARLNFPQPLPVLTKDKRIAPSPRPRRRQSQGVDK